MLMRTACKKDHFKPSFSHQKRPPGVAQRSEAKSGAKRLDFSSNQHASACNQARPNVFTLKAPSVSAPTQPLTPLNIQIWHIGKRLIDYKMMKEPGKKAVRTQATGIDTLREYLQTHKAVLANASPA